MTSRIVLPRLLLGLALVAGSLWLVLYRNQLDAALIENAMRTLGPWGPAAHVVLFALGTVLFVPGILFALAGGMLFDPVWGTILNLTGATLGATGAFLAARYLTGAWVRRKAGGRLEGSTRPISPTARAASSTKQSTVTATTRSELPSANGGARISPRRSWTLTWENRSDRSTHFLSASA
jgi:hypothetical protein